MASRKSRGYPPALTPEARENQLISLAIDVAERQLMEGTASAQVITHYLKLGSTKERLEMERLKRENEFLQAKTDALASSKHAEELYEKAVKAFRVYNGTEEVHDEDQDVY